MDKRIEKGSQVEWKTSKGKTHGKVEKKLTAPVRVQRHKVSASAEDPQYLVVSDKTGKKPHTNPPR